MKNSKKTLFVISTFIILLFSYANGTEARFTCSAESTENTFKAGTLRLDLVQGDFKKNEKLNIKIIQPGIEYGKQKCMQIVNNGTLDFQYVVTVNIYKNNPDNGVATLRDKLMVQVRTKGKSSNSNKSINYNGENYGILYDGLVTSLKSDDINGIIKSKNAEELYLCFYLPEYVDYNYQNKTANININVLATQITR